MLKTRNTRKQEMYTTVESWLSSDLTQNTFCKQEQLNKNTFWYWLNKYRKETAVLDTDNEAKNFIPVKFISPPEIPDHYDHLEICYPNGIRINCPMSVSTDQLQTLLSL